MSSLCDISVILSTPREQLTIVMLALMAIIHHATNIWNILTITITINTDIKHQRIYGTSKVNVCYINHAPFWNTASFRFVGVSAICTNDKYLCDLLIKHISHVILMLSDICTYIKLINVVCNTDMCYIVMSHLFIICITGYLLHMRTCTTVYICYGCVIFVCIIAVTTYTAELPTSHWRSDWMAERLMIMVSMATIC